jgi:hypothetical protein
LSYGALAIYRTSSLTVSSFFYLCILSLYFIIFIIIQGNNTAENRVMEMCCDAIRSMCCLESNRERLGEAGACEALARSLIKANKSQELACWVNRAIGHVAHDNEANRDRLGVAGACENMVMVLMKHANVMPICTEICWAIRNMAQTGTAM